VEKDWNMSEGIEKCASNMQSSGTRKSLIRSKKEKRSPKNVNMPANTKNNVRWIDWAPDTFTDGVFFSEFEEGREVQ